MSLCLAEKVTSETDEWAIQFAGLLEYYKTIADIIKHTEV
jgi:hypothetical protein